MQLKKIPFIYFLLPVSFQIWAQPNNYSFLECGQSVSISNISDKLTFIYFLNPTKTGCKSDMCLGYDDVIRKLNYRIKESQIDTSNVSFKIFVLPENIGASKNKNCKTITLKDSLNNDVSIARHGIYLYSANPVILEALKTIFHLPLKKENSNLFEINSLEESTKILNFYSENYIDIFNTSNILALHKIIKGFIQKDSSSINPVPPLSNDSLNFFSLSYNLPVSYTLKGLNKSDINYKYKYKSNYSFSFDYKHYQNQPLIPKIWFGYGFEISYSQTNFDLFPTNDNDITDTIFGLTDNYGDKYDKIVYAKGIQENISIETLSIIPQISFKYSKWFLSVSPGIKFSSVLSSRYNATSGEISYGGLYHQYNNDTMFSGLYDFYQNQPVYKEEQNLSLNTKIISLFIPVNLNIPIKKKYFLNLGGYWERSLSNILNNENQSKKISNGIKNYNSLLYRNENIKINSFAIRVGVSYKF